MDNTIERWQNLNKLVFVEIHMNNEIYVRYPTGTREDNRIRLLFGNPVGVYNWDYLNMLNNWDYTIAMEYIPSVMDCTSSVRMEGKAYNTLQPFEIALLHIKDSSKLLFINMVSDITRSELSLQSMLALRKPNIESFDKIEHRYRKAMETIENVDIHNFYLHTMKSFLTIHKKMLHLDSLSDDDIIDTFKYWPILDKYDVDTYLHMSGDYTHYGILTSLYPRTSTSGDIRKISMDMSSKTVLTELNIPYLYTNQKRNLLVEVMDKTNGKIVPYSTGPCRVGSTFEVVWLVSDEGLLKSAKKTIMKIVNDMMTNESERK